MTAAPRYAYREALVGRQGNYQARVVGSMDHEQAERVMGSYLTCSGIHLPNDPSPSTLTGDSRRFWDHVRGSANAYYKDQKIADKTAWKTTRLFFRQARGGYEWRPSLPKPGRAQPSTYIGDVGDIVYLGALIEYTYIDGNAVLHVCRFPDDDPPSLYWSDQNKCLYVFPGTDTWNGTCQRPDMWSPEAKTFRMWAQRDPRGARKIDIPETNVRLDGQMDTLVYRSDKWHDANHDQKTMKGSQEYIHQFGDGVGVWQGPGKVPSAIVVTGGCLDVEPRGIIH